MNLDQAIKKIISDNGVDILKERRFVGLLSDYQAFGQLPYAANMLRQIYSKGYGTKILKLYKSKDKTETVAFLSELRNKLGFDVEMLGNVFYAFSLPVQRNINQKQNPSTNSTSINIQSINRVLENITYQKRPALRDQYGGIYSDIDTNMEILHKFIGKNIPIYSICEGTMIIANSAFYVPKKNSVENSLCIKLLSIPNTVSVFGSHAFYNLSSLQRINIPNSVEIIGEYAFAGCSSLLQIIISNSVSKIENNTFKGCSSLQQITIPDSVMSIGDYAFEGCSSLEQITIPNSVLRIGEGAFSGCNRLDTIYLPYCCRKMSTEYYGIKGSCNVETTN